MKFQFKVQQYQTDAVESVVNIFNGQPHYDKTSYTRDLGKKTKTVRTGFGGQVLDTNAGQETIDGAKTDEEIEREELESETGYKNEEIALSDEQLLANIKKQQTKNNIRVSESLIKNIGRCSLDIEMETGTGKTYVYIKTMFELNKRYGWSKFIVVVPSIAIREGVKKTFEVTEEHFMEHYGKKARFFVYNSSNLNKLDTFSTDAGINVMIINTQAFATSLKEGSRSKESRIIYSKRDEFASRRPIDVIKANRPIIILDEPQKMGGEVTQNAIKNFNPLFSLNYSATHKKQHNLVYVLDALDAFNKRLVKKIEVKGFEVKNLSGTNQYIYFDKIILSKNKPPMARLEIEIALSGGGSKRKSFNMGVDDSLFYKSNEMEQYKNGFTISDINAELGTITFTNGLVLSQGEVTGDVVEEDMRRIQIRETIASHFDKEEMLFNMGIKTLSLFFIDEVAKYRQYDEDGNELLGEYGKMFEEEYIDALNEKISIIETPYQKYLSSIDVKDTHKGYFSIDKKGHAVNSSLKRGSEFSDDISAYDLILKNKERLLSFDEPTRFIFSHSALREGWDNPNVFQICTLKHSDSSTQKRQEVGRGLRLCINQNGNRMDIQTLGERIHDINKLTVVASESYRGFVGDLQSDIKNVLYDRPTKADSDYFKGKYVKSEQGSIIITDKQANNIEFYLISNGYVDMDRKVTDKYREDLASNTLAPLPEDLQPVSDGVHTLIQSVFDESALEKMIDNGKETKITSNELNDNFKKFKELWNKINHKYAYTVTFDSDELVEKAVKHINSELYVSELIYTVSTGEQKGEMIKDDVDTGESFTIAKTQSQRVKKSGISHIKYDLVGKIADGTVLTRKTVVDILKRIDFDKFGMFKLNPEEFISKVIKLINEQKATMVVDCIRYNKTEEKYDTEIFTAEKISQSYDKAYKAEKHIQDYVFTDGTAQRSVERRFAEELDNASEVKVYAKLPRGFKIPTPVGDYSPDWAIAFNEGTVKHIFFVAETKGTLESLNLRPIEKAKIKCAKRLFNEISTDNVRYHDVTDYKTLLDVMDSIK